MVNYGKMDTNTPIENLGFSTATQNALLQGDIKTLEDLLLVVRKGNLMKYRNIGKKKYDEVMDKLYEIQDSGYCKNLTLHARYEKQLADINEQIAIYEHAIQLLKAQRNVCQELLNRHAK